MAVESGQVGGCFVPSSLPRVSSFSRDRRTEELHFFLCPREMRTDLRNQRNGARQKLIRRRRERFSIHPSILYRSPFVDFRLLDSDAFAWRFLIRLGCNSIDIFVVLNLCLNPRLNHFPTRNLPKRILNPCLNLHLNSSPKFQMSIELTPWLSQSHNKTRRGGLPT